MRKKKVVLFASGRGSNATALYEAMRDGRIWGEAAALVCDMPQAAIIQQAQQWGLPIILADRKKFSDQHAFETYILEKIAPFQPDLLCLAGFMRILSAYFVAAYEGKIINIHPALLPSFRGLHAQRQAFEAGVKITGCTVHFVTAQMDDGPIIVQAAVPVYERDTVQTLAERILRKEHPSFIKAVALFCADKLQIKGHTVYGTDTGEEA